MYILHAVCVLWYCHMYLSERRDRPSGVEDVGNEVHEGLGLDLTVLPELVEIDMELQLVGPVHTQHKVLYQAHTHTHNNNNNNYE